MKLDTVMRLDGDLAKKLIGEHIHFTWKNRNDHTIETMPGKVLDYKDGKIIIDTMDIVMLDDKTSDENNKMIRTFDINEITNVYKFTKYKKNFYSLLDDLNESDLNNSKFDIITVFKDKVTAKILSYDALFITIILDKDTYDYPLYFIESLKRVN